MSELDDKSSDEAEGFVINIDGYKDNPTLWDHEHGHARQSLYLGPFYLFVIGIPSLLWACLYRKHKRGSYYAFYTEKWADKLGGVVRPKN